MEVCTASSTDFDFDEPVWRSVHEGQDVDDDLAALNGFACHHQADGVHTMSPKELVDVVVDVFTAMEMVSAVKRPGAKIKYCGVQDAGKHVSGTVYVLQPSRRTASYCVTRDAKSDHGLFYCVRDAIKQRLTHGVVPAKLRAAHAPLPVPKACLVPPSPLQTAWGADAAIDWAVQLLRSEYDDDCRRGCEVVAQVIYSVDPPTSVLLNVTLLLCVVVMDGKRKSWITRTVAVRCVGHALHRLDASLGSLITTMKQLLCVLFHNVLKLVQLQGNTHVHSRLFVKCLCEALELIQ